MVLTEPVLNQQHLSLISLSEAQCMRYIPFQGEARGAGRWGCSVHGDILVSTVPLWGEVIKE